MGTSKRSFSCELRIAAMVCAYLSCSCLAPALWPSAKPTLTSDTLTQAILKAKQGDKGELDGIAKSLGQRGAMSVPKELLPSFVGCLKEDDPHAQLVGAAGLWTLKRSESKDPLVAYVKAKDFRQLDQKARSGEIKQQDYVAHIRAASYAIMALGETGDKSLIPLLESLRGVKDLKFEFGSGPVEEALANLDADGVKSLSKLGPKADSGQVMKAASAIRDIKSPRQIPALIATVKDTSCSGQIRIAALCALGDLKQDENLPFFVSIANDEASDSGFRWWAAEGVAHCPTPEAETALLRMSESPDPWTRACGFSGLAKRNPGRYFNENLRFLLDASVPLELRQRASVIYLPIGSVTTETRDLVIQCLKAKTADGKPADTVRINVWRAYYERTGEEVPLELNDVKIARDRLSGVIESRASSSREPAPPPRFNEMRRIVDETLARVITQWSPGKEGDGK